MADGTYFLWGFSPEGKGLNGYGAQCFYDYPAWESSGLTAPDSTVAGRGAEEHQAEGLLLRRTGPQS